MDEFYTVNQAAIALKVHPLTIRRYIKEGKLKAVRAAGNIRIALNDLRNFTQNFIPHHRSQRSAQEQSISTKALSFSDPIFRLKARGFSISKLEQG